MRPRPSCDFRQTTQYGTPEEGHNRPLPSAKGSDRPHQFHISKAHRFLAKNQFRDQRNPKNHSRTDKRTQQAFNAALDGVHSEDPGTVHSVQGGNPYTGNEPDEASANREEIGNFHGIEVNQGR